MSKQASKDLCQKRRTWGTLALSPENDRTIKLKKSIFWSKLMVVVKDSLGYFRSYGR